MRLLDLLLSGKDTLQIAEYLGGIPAGWTEAAVYNQIAKERHDETLQSVSRAPIAIAPRAEKSLGAQA